MISFVRIRNYEAMVSFSEDGWRVLLIPFRGAVLSGEDRILLSVFTLLPLSLFGYDAEGTVVGSCARPGVYWYIHVPCGDHVIGPFVSAAARWAGPHRNSTGCHHLRAIVYG